MEFGIQRYFQYIQDSDYGSQIFPILGNRKLEVFPIDENWITEVGWMSEVTRGQVDNENNSQSQYLSISNIVQGGGLLYKSESIAIRNRNIMEYGLEHRKAVYTARKTQECYVRTWNRNRNKEQEQD